MTVLNEFSVVRIVDEHHPLDGCRLVAGFLDRAALGSGVVFYRFGLPHGSARDPRDNDDDGDGGEQPDVFQPLLKKARGSRHAARQRVPRRSPDINIEENPRQHSQQVG